MVESISFRKDNAQKVLEKHDIDLLIALLNKENYINKGNFVK